MPTFDYASDFAVKPTAPVIVPASYVQSSLSSCCQGYVDTGKEPKFNGIRLSRASYVSRKTLRCMSIVTSSTLVVRS